MINCIIIDDEPIAHQILEQYIFKYGQLILIGKFRNPIEAIPVLEKGEVNLIFLDIQMPLVNGLTFLKNLHQAPHVILTTAYPDYALQGFDLNAADYLLKPFSYERFAKAVNKVQRNFKTDATNEKSNGYLLLTNNQAAVKIFYDNIIFIEASGDYMKIHTTDNVYTHYIRMKHLEEQLPQQTFLRIHKSYIVALHKIQQLKKDEVVLMNNTVLPVSSSFKQKLIDVFTAK